MPMGGEMIRHRARRSVENRSLPRQRGDRPVRWYRHGSTSMIDTSRRWRAATSVVVAGLILSGAGFAAPLVGAEPTGGPARAGGSSTSTTAKPTSTKTTAKATTSGTGSKDAAGTTSTAPTTVPGQREAVSRQIDVVRASRDEVRSEVAAIDSRMKDQYARLVFSRAAAEQAMQKAAGARDRAADAKARAAVATEQVRDYAVEAFIHPPAQDELAVLSISRMDDAAFVSDVLHIVAEERREVVDVMVAAEQRATQEQTEAQQVAAEARSVADQAQGQLDALEAVRADQAQLASGLDDRLDAALAESASLKAIDAKAAKALAEEELALRASTSTTAPAAGPARVAAAQAVPAPTTSAPKGGGKPAPAPTPTTQPRPVTPVTSPPAPTGPPPPPPTGIVTQADVVRVGGIWVNKSIAGQVQSLLNAATAAGFSLGGGGFRDPAEQIKLRQAHCGSTTYAVYQMPASQCSPPTARPGTSMHERGLAIDFMSSGRLISSRSDPAFVWLSANAARFGFFNLPSEPWHWSVNGN